MTVIAYDGDALAVDRRINIGDRYFPGKKYTLWKGHVFMLCGSRSAGEVMIERYKRRKLFNDWPAFQSSDDFACLVIGKPDGSVVTIERHPIELAIPHAPVAFGTGSEAAMGAMLAGINAARAVEAACRSIATCGDGVDSFAYDLDKEAWTLDLAFSLDVVRA